VFVSPFFEDLLASCRQTSENSVNTKFGLAPPR
jgi:hypothetical protein